MFVVELSLGLLAGVVFTAVVVARYQVRLAVAALSILVLVVIVLALPVALSARAAVCVGLVIGLSVAATVLHQTDATSSNDLPESCP